MDSHKAAEVTQRSSAFAENPSSVPRIHSRRRTIASNASPGESEVFSGLCRSVHILLTHKHKHKHTLHIIFQNKSLKRRGRGERKRMREEEEGEEEKETQFKDLLLW